MFIIFPNQIYYDTSAFDATCAYIVEEPLFFHDPKYRPLNYHKCKLAYMVTVMKEYELYLKKRGVCVHYIPYNSIDKFYDKVRAAPFITFYDPLDHDLLQKYTRINPKIKQLDSPNFFMSRDNLGEFHSSLRESSKRTSHAIFYKFVKSKLNVMRNIPSTDKMNRSPLPTSAPPEPMRIQYKSQFHQYARDYINGHVIFKKNPGSMDHLSIWPATPQDAQKHLMRFVNSGDIHQFGKYQDAIHDERVFLFHSVLSPMLNIGILDPHTVLAVVLKTKTLINNQEGFVRQLIGWREYMRYLYIYHASDFKGASGGKGEFTRLSKKTYSKWTSGTTGMLPLDSEIRKALMYGYSHHIVRLMVFLNLFILLKVHPEDIYRWFMEIVAMDAYDWVMKSNIYCMGYFYPKAMTKMYISTSNYILKMSNYAKGSWCDTWDALFYAYLHSKSKTKALPAPYTRNYAYFKRLDAQKQAEMLRLAGKGYKEMAI